MAGQVQAAFVTNGGFETGDLTGWSVSGQDYASVLSGASNSGLYSFVGYDNNGFATLSQSIATTAGASYDFSFFSFSTANTPVNILRYQIGSGPIVGVTLTTSYAQTATSFVASGPSTLISFYFETDPGTGVWFIDDVIVDNEVLPSPVPEPASMAMWGIGALGMMFARRKR